MHGNKKTSKPKDLNFLHLSSAIDYELIDSGNRRKLERFGKYIFDRPEIEADWQPKVNKSEWLKCDWRFYEEKGKKGHWTNKTNAPLEWTIDYAYQDLSLKFNLKSTAFKHLGIFPEQAENWKFMQRELAKYKGEVKVLNLFAYTGAASVVAAAAGAQVTNVDSVKQVLNWGRQNAESNSVENIRWILEDARKFVQKAIRRGEKFQGVIMDPPAFGYGANKEKWKLENDLQLLLEDVVKLLHPKRHFFILNTYSLKLPLPKLKNMLRKVEGFPTKYDATILGLKSSKGQVLPLGNLIRYSK
jgi:23S rRNA (cytosine1962-C5)-methyltransferase